MQRSIALCRNATPCSDRQANSSIGEWNNIELISNDTIKKNCDNNIKSFVRITDNTRVIDIFLQRRRNLVCDGGSEKSLCATDLLRINNHHNAFVYISSLYLKSSFLIFSIRTDSRISFSWFFLSHYETFTSSSLILKFLGLFFNLFAA